MDTKLELILHNNLSELSRMALAIEEFGKSAGLEEKEIFQLNLVLDELVTNLIHYAHPEGGQHEFRLTISQLDKRLVIDLADSGVPFNPLETPAPNLEMDLEERPVGGLGIHFLRELMDDVSYEYKDQQNRLHIEKIYH